MAAAAKAPPKKTSSGGLLEKYAQPDQTPLTAKVPAKEKLRFELKSK
jgi:hypothetical protein